MKKLLFAATLALSGTAFAVDVGVSVQVSQPGVYGRIDIGRFPQPQVVVAQPIYVQRPTVVYQQPDPVYLWVPPGHRKNWKKHCNAYNACGVPVYFVRDDWYDSNVRRASGRDDRDDRGPGAGKGHGQGNGDNNGNGNGNGHGKKDKKDKHD